MKQLIFYINYILIPDIIMISPEEINSLLRKSNPLYLRPDLVRIQLIQMFSEYPNFKLCLNLGQSMNKILYSNYKLKC